MKYLLMKHISIIIYLTITMNSIAGRGEGGGGGKSLYSFATAVQDLLKEMRTYSVFGGARAQWGSKFSICRDSLKIQ